jgi:uncharacterized Fe-S cluster protein YjdI
LAHAPICAVPGFALLFEVMARPWIDAKLVPATIGAIASRPPLG